MVKLPPGIQVNGIINYLRRSREDVEREMRTGEDTITMQRNVMDRVLADYGLPYDQVVEIGSGDRIETRPVFQKVLHDVENGLYNCIAVKEISRLTRGDFRDYGVVYELLRQKRIYIITPYRLYDPKNANDMRHIRFEMFLSREEFETIRERMQGAKYSYAMAGKFMGSTPAYGYICHPKTQRLVIDEEKANIVRMIYDLYLHGLAEKEMSYRAIATFLTRAHIPSPVGLAEWNATTIKKILHNPVYIGEIQYSTTQAVERKRRQKPKEEWIIYPNAHEPIISLALFEQVHAKIDTRRKPSTRFDFETTELSGLICCAKCGRKMVRQASTSSYQKKDGTINSYEKEMLWCQTKGCTYVKYRAVEEMLLLCLQELQGLAVEEWEKYVAWEQRHGGDESDVQRVRRLEKRLEELRAQLGVIFRSFESQLYSEAEFSLRRTELSEHIAEAEALLTRLKQEANSERNDLTEALPPLDIAQVLASPAHMYRALSSKADKNRFLRQIIESVELTLTEKTRGNKPSRFRLDVALRMDMLLPVHES